jgi:hypothetical protein
MVEKLTRDRAGMRQTVAAGNFGVPGSGGLSRRAVETYRNRDDG